MPVSTFHSFSKSDRPAEDCTDGKAVHAGGLPKPEDLAKWLVEA
jgi:hypothetical protein